MPCLVGWVEAHRSASLVPSLSMTARRGREGGREEGPGEREEEEVEKGAEEEEEEVRRPPLASVRPSRILTGLLPGVVGVTEGANGAALSPRTTQRWAAGGCMWRGGKREAAVAGGRGGGEGSRVVCMPRRVGGEEAKLAMAAVVMLVAVAVVEGGI